MSFDDKAPETTDIPFVTRAAPDLAVAHDRPGDALADGVAQLQQMPPSRQLRHDPDYRDSVLPTALQMHIPPGWDDAERPSRPHSRRACDAETAAGRTKTSVSGRAEYCCCGARRPLTAAGEPDGEWLCRNTALATRTEPIDAGPADDGPDRRFWRRLLRHPRQAKEDNDDHHSPLS